MNRATIIVFALCLLAAIVTIGVLLVRAQDLPSEAQDALNQYIQHRYSLSQPATVQRLVRSSLPGNFSAAMSRATFGDSVFFGTTYNYKVQPVNLPGFPTITLTDDWRSAGGSHPVPFPPIDVWCVALKETEQPAPAVVYVAEHLDLYSADWLVHEPAGESKEIADALTKIGCDLKLGE